MEETGELMFLMSSADRLNLLYALREEKLRLSRLSSKISINVQETSRQLKRLQAARLVERDPQGLYALTLIGRMALQLLPSYSFLTARRDYLLSHDLSFLPPEFIERIGELAESEYAEEVGAILGHLEEVLSESQEYVWLMADQILMQNSVIERAQGAGGPSIRVVIPLSVARKNNLIPLPNVFQGRVEFGLVDDVKVGMAIGERVAGLAFPDMTGRMDFDRGLRSQGPLFHKWCADLFSYHWNRARRIS